MLFVDCDSRFLSDNVIDKKRLLNKRELRAG